MVTEAASAVRRLCCSQQWEAVRTSGEASTALRTGCTPSKLHGSNGITYVLGGVGKREQSNATFARGERPTRSMCRNGGCGRVLGNKDPRCIGFNEPADLIQLPDDVHARRIDSQAAQPCWISRPKFKRGKKDSER